MFVQAGLGYELVGDVFIHGSVEVKPYTWLVMLQGRLMGMSSEVFEATIGWNTNWSECGLVEWDYEGWGIWIDKEDEVCEVISPGGVRLDEKGEEFFAGIAGMDHRVTYEGLKKAARELARQRDEDGQYDAKREGGW